MNTKKPYESPTVEVVYFELSDHIATSADFGGGASGTEGIFDEGLWD